MLVDSRQLMTQQLQVLVPTLDLEGLGASGFLWAEDAEQFCQWVVEFIDDTFL